MKKVFWVFLTLLFTNHLFSQAPYDSRRYEELRWERLLISLDLKGTGLEIAPWSYPLLRRPQYDIFYIDYASKRELSEYHLSMAELIGKRTVYIDYIWYPGISLSINVNKKKFDYVVSSHGFDHIPNVIGWLREIFDVLHTGGILTLAVPDNRYTEDRLLPTTRPKDMIAIWLQKNCSSTTAPLFEKLQPVSPSNDIYARWEEEILFETSDTSYRDQEALERSIFGYAPGIYLETHRWIFTPRSLTLLLNKLNDLGILNIQVGPPLRFDDEFVLQITKLGNPSIKYLR